MTTQQSLIAALEEYFAFVESNVRSEFSSTLTSATSSESDTSVIEYYFYQYLLTDLFTEVQMLTGIRARTLADKNGNSLVDIAAIAPEDWEFVNLKLKEVTGKIFKIVAPYSTSVNGACIYDEGVTIVDYANDQAYSIDDYVRYEDSIYKVIAETEAGDLPTDETLFELKPNEIDTKDKITILIVSNGNLDPNIMKQIDTIIKTCITDYILSEWYKILGINEVSIIYSASYENGIDTLRSNLMHRKEPIVRIPSPL